MLLPPFLPTFQSPLLNTGRCKPGTQPQNVPPETFLGGRLHWRCRSSSAPITRSFRSLGIDIDDLPPAERASMDGQIAGDLNYGEWLQKQSAARQDEVVGATRGKLMREGKMAFDQFYTDRGVFIDLETLRARDAAAFKRAGL